MSIAGAGKILAVDDTPASLRLLSDILKAEGYHVRSSINGELALLSAFANPPELVLLDIRMPVMDGFEVCRRLKERAETRDVPVIFISALSETTEKVQGFALGAVDFVTKPYQREELLARVSTHLEVYRLRNRLEELVEARTREIRNNERQLHDMIDSLSNANAELERFAYIASHDLQEPLRTITAFSQLLERRYGGQMGPEADEYIQFIVSSSKRMRDLIKGLLSYARVTGQSKAFASVSTFDACHDAIKNLHDSIVESGARISVGELPEVMGDPVQLMQLFQNLIGNAIKFRRPDEPLHIAVAARPQDNGWVFSVADNGIGIENASQDIFEIFRRLHTSRSYPGSGIGLAISKRIVQRLQGRIWVESTPHQGSTFFFFLPGISRPDTLPSDTLKNDSSAGGATAARPPAADGAPRHIPALQAPYAVPPAS